MFNLDPSVTTTNGIGRIDQSRCREAVIVSGLGSNGLGFQILQTHHKYVKMGIRNLKCNVAPAKSLIHRRICSGRHTFNYLV